MRGVCSVQYQIFNGFWEAFKKKFNGSAFSYPIELKSFRESLNISAFFKSPALLGIEFREVKISKFHQPVDIYIKKLAVREGFISKPNSRIKSSCLPSNCWNLNFKKNKRSNFQKNVHLIKDLFCFVTKPTHNSHDLERLFLPALSHIHVAWKTIQIK